jgi:hypothetical protein
VYASRVDNRVCDESACDELVVCLADFYFLFWFVGKRCLYKSMYTHMQGVGKLRPSDEREGQSPNFVRPVLSTAGGCGLYRQKDGSECGPAGGSSLASTVNARNRLA